MAKARTKVQSINIRVATSVLATIQCAAEIQGRSVNNFVVHAAHESAVRTIDESNVLRLSVADQIALAKALLRPPPATPAMRRAIKQRARILRPMP
jgi:uncharacterized protein (DUF1778 family)